MVGYFFTHTVRLEMWGGRAAEGCKTREGSGRALLFYFSQCGGIQEGHRKFDYCG